MTREEMVKRVEELKFKRMCLACKDHWNIEDYRTDDKMLTEIRALNKELETL